jgi:hypothetical protein
MVKEMVNKPAGLAIPLQVQLNPSTLRDLRNLMREVSMKDLRLSVSADAKTLKIADGSTGLLTLSTEQLQALIPSLMRCRAMMHPALPFRDLRPKDKVLWGERMRWWTGLVDGRQILALHHPGLGWLGMTLTPTVVASLRDRLDEQLPLLANAGPQTMQ